jgi:hypothetical protein
MKVKEKRHCLPRIPGTIRDRTFVSVESEIREALRFEAKVNNCSVSFVQNTILADALNIKVPMRYYDIRKVARRVKETA